MATPAEKFAARNLVRKAIYDGILVPQPCERCGTKDGHAHHPDYSKPLEVIWLCGVCHSLHHAAIDRANRPPKPEPARKIRIYPPHPAIALLQQGVSVADAARQLGLTYERIRQIKGRMESRKYDGTNPQTSRSA